ncbi:unnamed protein product [Echinostoma caproni]|uniref:Reverse transcriptase domain-containing protein n=1 Tax=Echinostoma caproni TaxID=27848 RepID=A0A183AB32_9TREM|nr:unnamed protein product [Echinostoma caproni]
MRALTIYTKEFLLKIKGVIAKNHIAKFGVPVASQAHKYCKRGKRIRAGWQTALGRTIPNKMTVPTISLMTAALAALQMTNGLHAYHL